MYACIDLGSNMCRLLIAKKDTNNENGFVIVESISLLVALGKNPKFINCSAFYRISTALTKCMTILSKFKGIKIDCIATAIFRSANNATEILQTIHRQFGLKFRICFPDEEIMFSGYGSMHLTKEKQVVVMDMGGGSTEIGLFKTHVGVAIDSYLSLPYGLFYFNTNNFIPTDAYKILISFGDQLKHAQNCEHICFILARSGMMSTLGLYLKQNFKLSLNQILNKKIKTDVIAHAIQKINAMTYDEIIKSKLITNFDYIISTKNSLNFFSMILNILPVKYIILSNYGVREGVIRMAFDRI